MQRHLQLIITEPEPQDYPVQIECATVTVDLATGNVTLPGGFVCSLSELAHALDKARQAQFEFMIIEYDRKEKLRTTHPFT